MNPGPPTNDEGDRAAALVPDPSEAVLAELVRKVTRPAVSVVPVSLDQILHDPAKAAALPVEARGALIIQAAAVLAALGSSMLPAPEDRPDQLLTVEQASERLRLSRDYLYRHARKLPFFVETGARAVRFSERGIERYLRQHQGCQTS